jgi:hypothetical protein
MKVAMLAVRRSREMYLSAALSAPSAPRLLGLIWCPRRSPFGGALRILGMQRQFPPASRPASHGSPLAPRA